MTKAKIRWFDKLSGAGLVRLPNGDSVYINWTAIVNPNLHGWNYQSEAIQEMMDDVVNGAECLVTVHEDSHYTAIGHCIIL